MSTNAVFRRPPVLARAGDGDALFWGAGAASFTSVGLLCTWAGDSRFLVAASEAGCSGTTVAGFSEAAGTSLRSRKISVNESRIFAASGGAELLNGSLGTRRSGRPPDGFIMPDSASVWCASSCGWRLQSSRKVKQGLAKKRLRAPLPWFNYFGSKHFPSSRWERLGSLLASPAARAAIPPSSAGPTDALGGRRKIAAQLHRRWQRGQK
jgi:hypothetical protein